MKANLLILLAFLLLNFSACQQTSDSQPDLAQVKAEIQAMSDIWAAALNERDIEKIMDLYTEDAVSMPDMHASLEGKDAIRKHQEMEWAMRPANTTHSFKTLDVYVQGNSVTEVGLTTINDDTGKVIYTGKYMCLWEKQDGQYRCLREIYNGDQLPSPVADRSIHLFDMPDGLTEAEWSAALKEMNGVIAGIGYPGAGYYLYKTSNAEAPNHRYYFEGVWPSTEAYDKIHTDPHYVAASEKLGPLYDKIKAVEIYRRISLVQ